jgi:hypothetical protein
MIFRDFVKEQIGRLKSFADFTLKVPDDGQKEICRWLEERAGCDPKAKSQSTFAWLEAEEGARRVKAVIDECLTFESLPDLRTMRAVWDRLYPPSHSARNSCARCGGTGWVTVSGERGTSGCYPCTHGPRTPSEERMGIRINPATAKQYSAEERKATIIRENWILERGKRHDSRFPRVSKADVNFILAERE